MFSFLWLNVSNDNLGKLDVSSLTLFYSFGSESKQNSSSSAFSFEVILGEKQPCRLDKLRDCQISDCAKALAFCFSI